MCMQSWFCLRLWPEWEWAAERGWAESGIIQYLSKMAAKQDRANFGQVGRNGQGGTTKTRPQSLRIVRQFHQIVCHSLVAVAADVIAPRRRNAVIAFDVEDFF